MGLADSFAGVRFPCEGESNGRTIWIADAHRDDGKRFVGASSATPRGG
jgi:hypothetical protein